MNQEKSLTRSELIRQARKSFHAQSLPVISPFHFYSPRHLTKEECKELKAPDLRETENEGFVDTLKARVILATILFLALFLLCQFNAFPWLNNNLPQIIADNHLVENIYDKAALWFTALK